MVYKVKKGWAKTKSFPHKRHPAHFRQTGPDTVDYLTFTHHGKVTIKLPNGETQSVTTFPLTDNVSKVERAKNAELGLKKGENKSFVYPAVFRGTRSALGPGVVGEYMPVDEDKKLIEQMFGIFPLVEVPKTGGKNMHKKNKPQK